MHLDALLDGRHKGRQGDLDGVEIGGEPEEPERAAVVGERPLELALLTVEQDHRRAHLWNAGGVGDKTRDGARRGKGSGGLPESRAGKTERTRQNQRSNRFVRPCFQHQTTLYGAGSPPPVPRLP